MLTVRRADERGRFDHGWLLAKHSFSFGGYRDPAHMGFRSLRVLNEDVVQPGKGFGMHPHRDMEILTWVISGALRHEDSLGNGSVIRPGDIQRMTAGSGIVHSERNDSDTEPVHLLQIWIEPGETGLRPGYEQRAVPDSDGASSCQLVASPDGADDSVKIHQDARVHVVRFAEQCSRGLPIGAERHVWVQLAAGRVSIETDAGSRAELAAGDGAALSEEGGLAISAQARSELLVFDLA